MGGNDKSRLSLYAMRSLFLLSLPGRWYVTSTVFSGLRKGSGKTAPQTPLRRLEEVTFWSTREIDVIRNVYVFGGRAMVFIYHRTSKSAEGRQQLTAGKQSYLRRLVIDGKPKPIVLQLFTQRRAKPLAVPRVIVSSTTKCIGKKRIAREHRVWIPRKIVGNQRNTRIDFTLVSVQLNPKLLLRYTFTIEYN